MGSICFQVMVTLYKISLGGQATNIAPPPLWTLDVIFLLLYLRDQGASSFIQFFLTGWSVYPELRNKFIKLAGYKIKMQK